MHFAMTQITTASPQHEAQYSQMEATMEFGYFFVESMKYSEHSVLPREFQDKFKNYGGCCYTTSTTGIYIPQSELVEVMGIKSL